MPVFIRKYTIQAHDMISQAAKLQNGYGLFGNGLKSEGNEVVIADVWTDYSG